MVSPIVCSTNHTADRRRGHTTAAGQRCPLNHSDGPRRRLRHLVPLVAMVRLATLTFLAAIGWAPVAGASPVSYYFEAPSFTDLPDPIPTDEPTACDDNIRHAQTNCGVSFVSMLFTIDSDDIVPGEYFGSPIIDWLVFDGNTAASENLGFHLSSGGRPVLPQFEGIFGADASGTLTSLLVEISADLLGGGPGSFTRMTMLWDPNTSIPGLGVLNLTGRYCMDFVFCTTPDDYTDFSIINTLDPDTSPRATLRQVSDSESVPEPATLSLVGIGLLAVKGSRRWTKLGASA